MENPQDTYNNLKKFHAEHYLLCVPKRYIFTGIPPAKIFESFLYGMCVGKIHSGLQAFRSLALCSSHSTIFIGHTSAFAKCTKTQSIDSSERNSWRRPRSRGEWSTNMNDPKSYFWAFRSRPLGALRSVPSEPMCVETIIAVRRNDAPQVRIKKMREAGERRSRTEGKIKEKREMRKIEVMGAAARFSYSSVTFFLFVPD
jgi:hypothetical protein